MMGLSPLTVQSPYLAPPVPGSATSPAKISLLPQASGSPLPKAPWEGARPPLLFVIPNPQDSRYTAPEMAVRGRTTPWSAEAPEEGQAAGKAEEKAQGLEGAKSPQELMDESKCQTCEDRKYQDESDDSSVSFQTASKIDPSTAAATVRGHEMEHVYHNQAEARREDRKVVSQSVTLHSAICPECGKAFISGGTTRTATKANDKPPETAPAEEAKKGQFVSLLA